MTDIRQAVLWMQDGKAVRRSHWIKGERIKFAPDGYGFIDDTDTLTELGAESLLAEDWEIVDDTD